MRSNGFVAGGHECIVALRGCFDAAAQGRMDEPSSSTSLSVSGQYGYLPASDFIRWIPGYPS
jgi:hypothetical protein